MANRSKSVPENVAGDFFVDTTCIDCDTCRQIAPQVFCEAGDTAFVHDQPRSKDDRRLALQALVSCPTGSIGCQNGDDVKEVMGDFPVPVDGPVYYCGFNSPKSFGSNSYLVRRPDGNWLVDAPKFQPRLADSIQSLGGIANIFLTHQDDVADAERYANHFGARRFIHRTELSAQPNAEVPIDGDGVRELAPGVECIPTPGHTAGHLALLVDRRYLFTGDHLYFDRHERRLAAFRDYCWHSWPEQADSMRRLLHHDFEWILPGHGQRVHLPLPEMKRQLAHLADRMLRLS